MAQTGVLKGLADVRFGSLADKCSAKRHVRSTPESGHDDESARFPWIGGACKPDLGCP